MSEILSFLNVNSGALSAAFSGVVTIATVVYAWLTANLVAETRRMRMVQTEPSVQITYRTRDEWINLIDVSVRNIGLGPAYDLQFQVSSITQSQGTADLLQALQNMNSFKNGLRYLGPTQDFTSFWVSLADGDATKIDAKILVVCQYRSLTGMKYESRHTLDLAELRGIRKIGNPPLHSMAKSMEKIQSDIQSLATGFKRLQVDAFDQADRDAANATTADTEREKANQK